jgi:threonine aldolase
MNDEASKISFMNDYSYSAHPKIIEAVNSLDGECCDGYGMDSHSARAADALRGLLGKADADVHFLPGGTICNLASLAAFLRAHEAVIAAASAHISMHEAGAIEATGHKILEYDTADGKLQPSHIENAVATHTDEHMVKPRLVFISNPTEIGTVYTDTELLALRECCDLHGLYLYVDGARISTALAAFPEGFTLPTLARAADAFYFGGTKNGMLFGEALVISRDELKPCFRYVMKQRGAMLAKGFLIGAQFGAMLSDGLYLELARHANEQAQALAAGIADLGYEFHCASRTNQIFPIFSNETIERLEDDFRFYPWQSESATHSSVRIVTSWATTPSEVEAFIAKLRSLTS